MPFTVSGTGNSTVWFPAADVVNVPLTLPYVREPQQIRYVPAAITVALASIRSPQCPELGERLMVLFPAAYAVNVPTRYSGVRETQQIRYTPATVTVALASIRSPQFPELGKRLVESPGSARANWGNTSNNNKSPAITGARIRFMRTLNSRNR